MFKKNQAFCHTRAFWMFVIPSLVLFGVFFLLPLVLSIVFSFTNYDGWKTMDFVGIQNYTKVLKDSDFYKTIGRTMIYAVCNIPFKVIIPLLLAALVTSKRLKGTTLVRTLIYIPVLLSALVAGITINWMFGQEYGLINFILKQLGITPLQWSLNPALATVVISVASNWISAGYYMLLYVGGINNISKELYEAVNVDGAKTIQAFFRITLPLLMPTTFIVLLLSTVSLLKEYALVQGITQGGPGSATTFIVQYIYNQGFDQYRYGYASAIGILASILFIIIAVVQFKATKGGFFKYVKNSLFLAVVGTLITVIVSAMCGYALAIYRKEISYVNKVFAVFLLGTLIPGEILTIGQFTVVSEIGLYNNIWGCILPVVTTTTGIFMYRQHYMTIPLELAESARLDGASEFHIFRRIMIPLGSSVTVTLTIFSFMWR